MGVGGRSQPETPWEFYPDDDEREPPRPAEERAMHIERPERSVVSNDDIDVTVHYLDDEDPEVPDTTRPPETTDVTPEVEDLLIWQHYLPSEDS